MASFSKEVLFKKVDTILINLHVELEADSSNSEHLTANG